MAKHLVSLLGVASSSLPAPSLLGGLGGATACILVLAILCLRVATLSILNFLLLVLIESDIDRARLRGLFLVRFGWCTVARLRLSIATLFFRKFFC